MSLMRRHQAASYFRPVRNAGTHGLGDHAHWQALKLRQNVAPEVHPIERSIIAPRHHGLALLTGRGGSALLSRRRRRRIVTGCAHGCDLGWTPGLERGRHRPSLHFHLIGEAAIAVNALTDREL